MAFIVSYICRVRKSCMTIQVCKAAHILHKSVKRYCQIHPMHFFGRDTAYSSHARAGEWVRFNVLLDKKRRSFRGQSPRAAQNRNQYPSKLRSTTGSLRTHHESIFGLAVLRLTRVFAESVLPTDFGSLWRWHGRRVGNRHRLKTSTRVALVTPEIQKCTNRISRYLQDVAQIHRLLRLYVLTLRCIPRQNMTASCRSWHRRTGWRRQRGSS